MESVIDFDGIRTNVGKEPIMLTQIGASYYDGTGFIVKTTNPLPRMLSPGEYFIDYLVDADKAFEKEIRHFAAIDSAGREWKAHYKDLNKLTNDYESGKFNKEPSQRHK